MTIKLRPLIITVLICSLAALVFMAYRALGREYSGLLLAVPVNDGQRGVNVETIEKINDEKLMLTYECLQNSMVSALSSNYSAEIKATNYTYPFVMGYHMASGGFFTKDNQEQKQKLAVLNELAAFEMFGGTDAVGCEISFNGNKYRVAGVIYDGSESLRNIYIPVTLTNNQPNTFVARMEEGKNITPEYAENELKQAGITTDSHDFVSLESLAERTLAVASIAVCMIIFATLVIVVKFCIKSFRKQLESIKEGNKHFYLKELIFKSPAVVIKPFLTACLTVGTFVCFIRVLTIFVDNVLRFDISLTGTNANIPGSFKEGFLFLQNMNLYSSIVFIIFVLSLLYLSVARE